MKAVMRVLLVIVLSVLSTTAFAQIKPGAFNIGPNVGAGWFEGNQDLDTGLNIGLRGGYDFTKHWGIEATFNWIPTRYEYYEAVVGPQGLVSLTEHSPRTNVFNYRIEGIYHFYIKSAPRLVPFLTAGIGGQSIDYTSGDKSDKTRFAPAYGAGLKYFLTERIALRGDVRHVLPIGSVYNNLEVTMGLAYYFGAKKAAAAPEPPPPPPEKEMFDERVRLNVEFDFDKSNIRPEYHDELKKVGDFMNKYPETNIVLEGHTDSRGSEEYNQKLSQRRVDSVKNYIIEKFNIDEKRLTTVGYGETRPIADNNTDGGRQRNRRVEAVSIK
jgi:OOP family OmpA-OmpF porin